MFRYFFAALIYFPMMFLIGDTALFLCERYYGYDPTMHYATVSFECSSFKRRPLYPEQVHLSPASVSEDEFYLKEAHRQEITELSLAIAAILAFATVAFSIIYFFAKKIKRIPKQLLIVIAGLWFIQPLQLLQAILGYECGGAWQILIAKWFHLPPYSLLITLSAIAILISAYLFFKVIPKNERTKFVAGSVLGSGAGLAAWMFVIGPAVLP